MKSLETINEEIGLHENNWAHYKAAEELNKYQGRITFLRNCKYYLESEPTVSFIEKEIKKLVGSNIRCKEKLDEIEKNEQETALKFIVKNMKDKIRANNRFLKTLMFIQNKKTDLFNGGRN